MSPAHSVIVDPLIAQSAEIEVAKRKYLRSIRSEVAASSQSAVARRIGVTPSAVHQKLSTAERLAPEIPDGFIAAGPYEIAELYAAGKIDRDTLVEQLKTWPYVDVKGSWSELWDTQASLPGGTWQEVVDAYDDGYLDGDTYEEIDLHVHP